MRAVTRILSWIEALNEFVGRAVSWLMLGVVIGCFTVAILRYVFSIGWIWMQESYIWIHAVVFMLAMAFTLLHDSHVRVDIFYRSASSRYKAWTDLLGTIFFLLPTLGVIWWVAYPYVWISWVRLEASREAGGLPALYLLKSVVLVFIALMMLQGIATVLRCILVIAGRKEFEFQRQEGEVV